MFPSHLPHEWVQSISALKHSFATCNTPKPRLHTSIHSTDAPAPHQLHNLPTRLTTTLAHPSLPTTSRVLTYPASSLPRSRLSPEITGTAASRARHCVDAGLGMGMLEGWAQRWQLVGVYLRLLVVRRRRQVRQWGIVRFGRLESGWMGGRGYVPWDWGVGDKHGEGGGAEWEVVFALMFLVTRELAGGVGRTGARIRWRRGFGIVYCYYPVHFCRRRIEPALGGF